MDSETGESFRDKETGEMPASAKVNLETGESEINRSRPEKQNNTRKFRIPSKQPPPKQNSLNTIKRANKSLVPVKAPQIFNTNDVTPCLLFLLPTTLFFYPILAACISFIEVVLHVWAHKKNKKLTNKDIYYQSPLHIFVSEFCGSCREERSKDKIISIQDKRNYKFIKYSIDCVHGIVT